MGSVVSKDKSNGRVMVLASGILSVPAIKSADGIWTKGTFSADDLKDNFYPVEDPVEISYWIYEAKSALWGNRGINSVLKSKVYFDESGKRLLVLAYDRITVPVRRLSDGSWGIGTFYSDDLNKNFVRLTNSIEIEKFVLEAEKARDFGYLNKSEDVIGAEEIATGRVFLNWPDGFTAIKEKGVWQKGFPPSDDLEDNFVMIESLDKVKLLEKEAKRALKKKRAFEGIVEAFNSYQDKKELDQDTAYSSERSNVFDMIKSIAGNIVGFLVLTVFILICWKICLIFYPDEWFMEIPKIILELLHLN